ncbi:IS630 family transposase [Mucilaginibacter calamicampi]|uniref:IS630 family transposase n=1 Tax=Mucilaginibacter calamicampi TaxID=1302352 RepID=A0ABW2Z0A4_9SPHI
MTAAIPKHKRDLIRSDYLGARIHPEILAKKLELDRTTINNYRRCFKTIEREYPDKLHDYSFCLMPHSLDRNRHEINREAQLVTLFPEIMDSVSYKKGISLKPLYAIYKSKCPNGYAFKPFVQHLFQWRKDNNICNYHHLRIKHIHPNDLVTLTNWKKGTTVASKFRKAVIILGSYNGKHIKHLAAQIESKVQTVLEWMEIYRTSGIEALERKVTTVNHTILESRKVRQDNLIKLVHQSPKLYQLNRTSWRLRDLSNVYQRLYGEYICISAIKDNLHRAGYGFRRSRQTLTSPDPKFRQKMDFIKNILGNLRNDEKFFSIDEYGHFSVKLKGGRSLSRKGENKVVPQLQKSKGFMVVTAAIELSTNQITHFYSRKKDTEEMIKLIDLLIIQYPHQRTLYLSWDAAAWHNSKLLKARLEQLNDIEYRTIHNNPEIKLAPLPSCAQFLNVIESIFSGLAKAVIHNSDYQSLEDCQSAIDMYFRERNEYFLANPKHAGKVIWGKEKVKTVFKETNHCAAKK